MKIKMCAFLILAMISLSAPSLAHRFSTSFLTLSPVSEGIQAWNWRIVEHDIETFMSAAGLTIPDSDDRQLAALVKVLMTVNDGCMVQLNPSESVSTTVYAGQTYVDLNGQIICVEDDLLELSVENVFSSISDHKVVLTIPADSIKEVLSMSQTSWTR